MDFDLDLLYYNKSMTRHCKANLISSNLCEYLGINPIDIIMSDTRFNNLDGLPEYKRSVRIHTNKVIDHYNPEDEKILMIDDLINHHDILEKCQYDILKDKSSVQFLKDRGVTTKDVIHHQLGTTMNLSDDELDAIGLRVHPGIRSWVGTEFIKGIIQPILHSDGKWIGYHLRSFTTLPKIKFISSIPRTFVYNLDNAINSHKDYIIITEGMFDQMTLERQGYDNVVHLCNAMPSPVQLAQILVKCKKKHKLVVSGQDSDGVGLNAQMYTLAYFDKYNMSKGGILIPEDAHCKDLDEYYRSANPLPIEDLIVPLSVLISKVTEVIDRSDLSEIDFNEYINNRVALKPNIN